MNRLRTMREHRLMPQAELARRAGLTQPAINRIETGKSRPRMKTKLALLRALGMRPADLTYVFPPGDARETPDGRNTT